MQRMRWRWQKIKGTRRCAPRKYKFAAIKTPQRSPQCTYNIVDVHVHVVEVGVWQPAVLLCVMVGGDAAMMLAHTCPSVGSKRLEAVLQGCQSGHQLQALGL